MQIDSKRKRLKNRADSGTFNFKMEIKPYYLKCLRECYDQKKTKNRRYSVRAFASHLGIDPGLMAAILGGKRIPSAENVRKIIVALSLSPQNQDLFIASIIEERRKRSSSRVREKFEEVKSERILPREIAPHQFSPISEWYYYAILELTQVKHFKSDPEWIASTLGIDILQIREAIRQLMEYGYLSISKNGTWNKQDPVLITGQRTVTTEDLRKRQKQILEKSIIALERVPISERNHASATVAIDSRRIPEAKRMIDEFIDYLCKYLEASERDQVYELSVGLFPLQK